MDSIGVVDLVGEGVADPEVADVGPEIVEPEIVNDFAEKLVRRFLQQFENEKTRPRMMRLLKSSFTSAREGRMFYRVLAASVVNPVARAAGVHSSAVRMELVVGQLSGTAIMRYVLRVEPLASASVDEVVAQLAPAIRATLKS